MSYKIFTNKDCEAFPCHEIDDKKFNCLFCYCPLYFIECPGSYKLLKNGLKDCMECAIPHKGDRAWNVMQDYILKHWEKCQDEPSKD